MLENPHNEKMKFKIQTVCTIADGWLSIEYALIWIPAKIQVITST